MVHLPGDLGRPKPDDGPRIRGCRGSGGQSRHSGSHRRPDFEQRQEAFLALDVGAKERFEAGQVGHQRDGVLREDVAPPAGVDLQSFCLRRDLLMVEPNEAGRPRTSAGVGSGKSQDSSQAMWGLRSASIQCNTLRMPAAR